MKKNNNNTFLSMVAGAAIAALFLSLICLGFSVEDGGVINWTMAVIIIAIMVISGVIAYRAMTVLERREKK